MTDNEVREKLNEVREVVNAHSLTIKKLNEQINEMKLVLGYYEQKEKLEIFFKTLENQGITKDDLYKSPDLLTRAMGSLRKL